MDARNYFGFDGWASDDYGSVKGNFRQEIGAEPDFIWAVYSTPAYEGSADLVFFRDGKWWHASGGHCSCFGLEDQWRPEAIDPQTHLAAVVAGKNVLLVSDSEGDYPQATQENFNSWLAWALKASGTASE